MRLTLYSIYSVFWSGTCTPLSTTARCWTTWWGRTTSAGCWPWAAGSPWPGNDHHHYDDDSDDVMIMMVMIGTASPSPGTPNTSAALTRKLWTTVKMVRITSNYQGSIKMKGLEILQPCSRRPGEAAPVLADGDLQPQEGGEALLGAPGARTGANIFDTRKIFLSLIISSCPRSSSWWWVRCWRRASAPSSTSTSNTCDPPCTSETPPAAAPCSAWSVTL